MLEEFPCDDNSSLANINDPFVLPFSDHASLNFSFPYFHFLLELNNSDWLCWNSPLLKNTNNLFEFLFGNLLLDNSLLKLANSDSVRSSTNGDPSIQDHGVSVPLWSCNHSLSELLVQDVHLKCECCLGNCLVSNAELPKLFLLGLPLESLEGWNLLLEFLPLASYFPLNLPHSSSTSSSACIPVSLAL